MDKSFEGLLFSIILHLALILFLLKAHLQPFTPAKDVTEVTLIEKPATEKSKAFVTETDKKETFDQLKDTADFLSQFTKRVKKQLRARNNGPTINAAPKAQPQQQPQKPQPNKMAGLENKNRGEGIGTPGGMSNPMRNVAIGQSSISEYIPGIEEGAFTALNTDQFTYYAFFARMNEQVRSRWIDNVRSYMARLTTHDLEVLARIERQWTIEIILSPDGTYESTSLVHTSSGDRELDQTALRAFRDAAPFNNPPRGMIESDGKIHLRYGFIVHFRPPSFGGA